MLTLGHKQTCMQYAMTQLPSVRSPSAHIHLRRTPALCLPQGAVGAGPSGLLPRPPAHLAVAAAAAARGAGTAGAAPAGHGVLRLCRPRLLPRWRQLGCSLGAGRFCCPALHRKRGTVNKVTPVPAMHRLSAGHHQTRPLRCNPSPRPPPGQDAVDSLADAALAARTRFQPRELAHVLWNMSRLGYVDDPFYLAFVPGALDVAFWGMHRGDVHLSGH